MGPSSWRCGICWCSGTDAGGRGQQGVTLQGPSVPGGPRVLTMGRPQWQPWRPTEMSPVGVPLSQGTLCSHQAFLLILPEEGAFPAFPWSDLVSQCLQCAVPALCPRGQRALAHPHRGSGLPGCWLPSRQQEWWVTKPMGELAFGEVWPLVLGHTGVSCVPCPASSSQALLRAPSAALVPGGRGAAWLHCGVLAGKAQHSRPLHKAALFRTNPPRIGLHFCQVIHQHVNGKGWSPLNQ